MNYEVLDDSQCEKIITGEAVTLTAVLAVVAVAVIAVVAYKLFTSNKGGATIGGWKFSWN